MIAVKLNPIKAIHFEIKRRGEHFNFPSLRGSLFCVLPHVLLKRWLHDNPGAWTCQFSGPRGPLQEPPLCLSLGDRHPSTFPAPPSINPSVPGPPLPSSPSDTQWAIPTRQITRSVPRRRFYGNRLTSRHPGGGVGGWEGENRQERVSQPVVLISVLKK